MNEIASLLGMLATVVGAILALLAGLLTRRAAERDTSSARATLREVLDSALAQQRNVPVRGGAATDKQRVDASAEQALLNLDYHAQSLGQNKTMFNISLAGAMLGFGVIITGVILALLGMTDAAILGTVSGVVMEAVAGLFFRESNRARSLMRDFFDSLRVDIKNERDLRTALTLVDQVETPATRDALRGAISLRLVDGITDTTTAAQWLRDVGLDVSNPPASEASAPPEVRPSPAKPRRPRKTTPKGRT